MFHRRQRSSTIQPTRRAPALSGATRARTAAAVTAACAVLAACGPGAAHESAGGRVDPNATLRFSYGVGTSSLDPHLTSSSYDMAVLDLVYDRLVSMGRDAKFGPGLATSWSYAPDGSALTFELRQGVVFHDGTAFNAQAVKANIERGKTIKGSQVAEDLARVERVEVLSDTEVRLDLSEPDAALIGTLSRSAGMMVSPAAFGKDLSREAAGSGPYTVVDYRPNSRIVFARFKKYWEPAAARAARIEYQIQPDDTTRLNALRAGEVDMTVLQEPQIAGAKSAGLKLGIKPTLGFVHMQLNTSRPFFTDKRVRRAISVAIDRDAIVQGVGFGHGSPAYQLYPEGTPAHDPGIKPAHDADRARQMLAEAGQKRLSFEAVTPTTHQNYAVAVQGQLAEAGVEMKVRVVPNTKLIDTFYVRKEGDAIITPVGPRADPAQLYENFLGADSVLNVGKNNPPETAKLLAKARMTVDEGEREAAFHALARLVSDNALTIPLVHPATVVATSAKVDGAEVNPMVVPVLRGIGVRAG